MDQIFNCDETGLDFRLLPDKTHTATIETSADGRKKSKERVTINACSNASGTIKLPLQVHVPTIHIQRVQFREPKHICTIINITFNM